MKESLATMKGSHWSTLQAWVKHLVNVLSGQQNVGGKSSSRFRSQHHVGPKRRKGRSVGRVEGDGPDSSLASPPHASRNVRRRRIKWSRWTRKVHPLRTLTFSRPIV